MSWTIIRKGNGRKVLCRCSCGKVQFVDKYNLRNGATASCRDCSVRRQVIEREEFTCECGATKIMRKAELRGADSWRCRTCGDLARRSISSSVPSEHYVRLANKVKHAIRRCTDETHPHWSYYGGRGIRVHPGWIADPAAFVEYLWQLPGSSDQSLELDRKDNDEGYVPGNLKFSTHSESMKNRRERTRDINGKYLPSELT